MPNDTEPDTYVGELDVILEDTSDSPGIEYECLQHAFCTCSFHFLISQSSIIIVHGMGQDPREYWMVDSTKDEQSAVLEHLHKQTKARIMIFNSKVNDEVESFSASGLAQISKLLLKEVQRIRSGNHEVSLFSSVGDNWLHNNINIYDRAKEPP